MYSIGRDVGRALPELAASVTGRSTSTWTLWHTSLAEGLHHPARPLTYLANVQHVEAAAVTSSVEGEYEYRFRLGIGKLGRRERDSHFGRIEPQCSLTGVDLVYRGPFRSSQCGHQVTKINAELRLFFFSRAIAPKWPPAARNAEPRMAGIR